MPLNPVTAAQTAEKIATILNVPADAKKGSIELWTKIVGCIYDSITQNAVVDVSTVSVPSLGLVAPPGVTGGPVTGQAKTSGTGTIK